MARSLKRIGLNWGADIGLLGFDELEWAELAGVGITTLKQPTRQIGYAALEQVVRRIEGRAGGAGAGFLRRAYRARLDGALSDGS